jgi:hypothetical protein
MQRRDDLNERGMGLLQGEILAATLKTGYFSVFIVNHLP